MSKEKTAALSGLYRPLWPALALLAASCVLFMTLGANGHWDFVLPRRGMVLASLLLVAYSVGVSTLLFQTLTNNPILTPSVLGFDSLYVFLQTLLVAVLGGIGYSSLPQTGKFAFELAAMVGGSLLLFQTLMRQGGRDLARMILIGVVFGILFRSLSSLLQRPRRVCRGAVEHFCFVQYSECQAAGVVGRYRAGVGLLPMARTV